MPDEEPEPSNPIVAAAMRIRARRDLAGEIDSATSRGMQSFEDAEQSLRAFADRLRAGIERVNSILGKQGVKLIVLERPLRIRLRFREERVALDLDEVHQLIRVSGADLAGEYQFDPDAPLPALINLSKISTEAGYGERLTAASLLKKLTADAELPRPPHLDEPPLKF
ncbi:MAG: hypothetical protein JO135_06255 [Candidatus Eremiobacteraeota bacterium]|nr:hypothetical protein [Candidatus Eremiobacteraeota bacterium]